MRSGARLLAPASLPIWSCSVWGLPCLQPYGGSGALLPHLFTLTTAWEGASDKSSGHPGRPPKGGVAEAVCFLWHWPSTGLETRVPDVIRHTALRSSDFPPPAIQSPRPPAATARRSCQRLVYRESGSPERSCIQPSAPAISPCIALELRSIPLVGCPVFSRRL